jgi:hypothetical protein
MSQQVLHEDPSLLEDLKHQCLQWRRERFIHIPLGVHITFFYIGKLTYHTHKLWHTLKEQPKQLNLYLIQIILRNIALAATKS